MQHICQCCWLLRPAFIWWIIDDRQPELIFLPATTQQHTYSTRKNIEDFLRSLLKPEDLKVTMASMGWDTNSRIHKLIMPGLPGNGLSKIMIIKYMHFIPDLVEKFSTSHVSGYAPSLRMPCTLDHPKSRLSATGFYPTKHHILTKVYIMNADHWRYFSSGNPPGHINVKCPDLGYYMNKTSLICPDLVLI